MKKTLVALAVLAAAGTSFAQVTISGKLGFSYQKNSTPGGGSANHGMAMADGDLNFTATEDLGGGMAITAKSAFASRGRDSGINARDASLSLKTGVGLFTLGAVETCSAILNTAGAPVSLADGHDGGPAGTDVIDRCANIDTAMYHVPVGPVTLMAAYSDSIRAQSPATTSGGSGDLSSTTVGITYADAAWSAGLDHTVFDNTNATLNGTFLDGLTRTRLYGAYDFGVAKLGAGLQVNNNDKASQSSISVNVPLGAVSLGLVHSMRNSQNGTTTGLAAANNRSGTAIGLKYDLSKMTNVNFSYGTYNMNTATTTREQEFRLRLMKSF